VTGYTTATGTPVTVSVQFAGTGALTQTATHQDVCWDGVRTCQSVRLGAGRSATGALTIDDQTGTGVGSLSYVQGVDAAAPKFELGYTG